MLLRARNGARRRPERCGGPGKRRQVSTVILLRHGQSAWNGGVQQQPARFTGWVDVPLTVRGRVEAVAAGQLLRARGYEASKVDVAFTSDLQRAHETCELALASMAGPDQLTWSPDRIRRDGRLNERHYGAVQGKFKNDPALTEKYGFDTVRAWRRSMYGAPPPLLDGDEHFSPLAPATESLADCQKRALHCFDTVIAPALFDEVELPTPPDERTVLIVAHANTIRSLMAHFDAVPEASVPKLHVPNSVPILYHFDQKTRKPHSTKLQSAAGGSHARWLLSPENHAQVRKAVKSGGMLTRALFDSWTDGLRALPGGKASADESDSRALTIAQLEAGLRGLENDPHTDCTVVSVAKKIVRELSYTGRETIALAEFERRATEAAEVLLSRQHIWNVHSRVEDEETRLNGPPGKGPSRLKDRRAFVGDARPGPAARPLLLTLGAFDSARAAAFPPARTRRRGKRRRLCETKSNRTSPLISDRRGPRAPTRSRTRAPSLDSR